MSKAADQEQPWDPRCYAEGPVPAESGAAALTVTAVRLRPVSGSLAAVEVPAPDANKLLASWMEWERGDVTPGRVMANLKTGGLRSCWKAFRPKVAHLRIEIPRPNGFLPGAPAPWERLPESDRAGITVDEVCRALAASAELPALAHVPRTVMPAELPAQADQRPSRGPLPAVRTRRRGERRPHQAPGALALPRRGGVLSGRAVASGEVPVEAALREANEEIGAVVADIEVIGQLTPLTTSRSPALVHCFVGKLSEPAPEAPAFVPDPNEVDKVFWVPLAQLAMGGAYHEELWPSRQADEGTPFRGPIFPPRRGHGVGSHRAPARRAAGRCPGPPWANRGARGRWRLPEEAQRLAGRYPGQIMMCPRCGIYNQSGRSSCSRCSGLLAPAPVGDGRPLPAVLPVTHRRRWHWAGLARALRWEPLQMGPPGRARR